MTTVEMLAVVATGLIYAVLAALAITAVAGPRPYRGEHTLHARSAGHHPRHVMSRPRCGGAHRRRPALPIVLI